MGYIKMEYREVEELQKVLDEFGGSSLRVINDVLHGEAGDLIAEKAQRLLPASGRKWRKKKTAAGKTMPFQKDTVEMLSVTVKSKTGYQYLYFPDDGSNTRRHAGNQQFMRRGAERATEDIIDLCLGRLAGEIGG